MLHRDKRIGKSLYRVVKSCNGEQFKIMEIYNDNVKAYSSRSWDNVEEALEELKNIDRERMFTDKFYSLNTNVQHKNKGKIKYKNKLLCLIIIAIIKIIDVMIKILDKMS